MIFVAVGTQFPFDRLIRFMDEWAAENNEEVIAQIAGGDYKPKHIQFERFMDGEQYKKNIQDASVFVSHAGMGNIISAKELQTPIIVINRQFKLGEHRNDHQADGLKWMGKLDGVYAATTQDELNSHLDSNELQADDSTGFNKHAELTDYISDFIES
ncbi:MAG TPA: glycosyl transferase family 28 [Leucothrix mucor]|nr:glycosyl transferase family 28 [Leucothrix mucor]